MNDNHNSRFFDGFILGIIIGAAGVFLFGTKSGKNIVKILSEQGLDGIRDLIDEYNESVVEEEFEEEAPVEVEDIKTEKKEQASHTGNGIKEAAKKRFFRRK